MEESKANEGSDIAALADMPNSQPFAKDVAKADKAAAKLAAKQQKESLKAEAKRLKELAKARKSTFKGWAKALKATDPHELRAAAVACCHHAFMTNGGGIDAVVKLLGAKDPACSAVAIDALESFLRPREVLYSLPALDERTSCDGLHRQSALRVLRSSNTAGKWDGMAVLVARFRNSVSALRTWRALFQGVASMSHAHKEREQWLAALLRGGDPVTVLADIVVDSHVAQELSQMGPAAVEGVCPPLPSMAVLGEAFLCLRAITEETVGISYRGSVKSLRSPAQTHGAVIQAVLQRAVVGTRNEAERRARAKVLDAARAAGVDVERLGLSADPSLVQPSTSMVSGPEDDGAGPEDSLPADLMADSFLRGPSIASSTLASSNLGSEADWARESGSVAEQEEAASGDAMDAQLRLAAVDAPLTAVERARLAAGLLASAVDADDASLEGALEGLCSGTEGLSPELAERLRVPRLSAAASLSPPLPFRALVATALVRAGQQPYQQQRLARSARAALDSGAELPRVCADAAGGAFLSALLFWTSNTAPLAPAEPLPSIEAAAAFRREAAAGSALARRCAAAVVRDLSAGSSLRRRLLLAGALPRLAAAVDALTLDAALGSRAAAVARAAGVAPSDEARARLLQLRGAAAGLTVSGSSGVAVGVGAGSRRGAERGSDAASGAGGAPAAAPRLPATAAELSAEAAGALGFEGGRWPEALEHGALPGGDLVPSADRLDALSAGVHAVCAAEEEEELEGEFLARRASEAVEDVCEAALQLLQDTDEAAQLTADSVVRAAGGVAAAAAIAELASARDATQTAAAAAAEAAGKTYRPKRLTEEEQAAKEAAEAAAAQAPAAAAAQAARKSADAAFERCAAQLAASLSGHLALPVVCRKGQPECVIGGAHRAAMAVLRRLVWRTIDAPCSGTGRAPRSADCLWAEAARRACGACGGLAALSSLVADPASTAHVRDEAERTLHQLLLVLSAAEPVARPGGAVTAEGPSWAVAAQAGAEWLSGGSASGANHASAGSGRGGGADAPSGTPQAEEATAFETAARLARQQADGAVAAAWKLTGGSATPLPQLQPTTGGGGLFTGSTALGCHAAGFGTAPPSDVELSSLRGLRALEAAEASAATVAASLSGAAAAGEDDADAGKRGGKKDKGGKGGKGAKADKGKKGKGESEDDETAAAAAAAAGAVAANGLDAHAWWRTPNGAGQPRRCPEGAAIATDATGCVRAVDGPWMLPADVGRALTRRSPLATALPLLSPDEQWRRAVSGVVRRLAWALLARDGTVDAIPLSRHPLLSMAHLPGAPRAFLADDLAGEDAAGDEDDAEVTASGELTAMSAPFSPAGRGVLFSCGVCVDLAAWLQQRTAAMQTGLEAKQRAMSEDDEDGDAAAVQDPTPLEAEAAVLVLDELVRAATQLHRASATWAAEAVSVAGAASSIHAAAVAAQRTKLASEATAAAATAADGDDKGKKGKGRAPAPKKGNPAAAKGKGKKGGAVEDDEVEAQPHGPDSHQTVAEWLRWSTAHVAWAAGIDAAAAAWGVPVAASSQREHLAATGRPQSAAKEEQYDGRAVAKGGNKAAATVQGGSHSAPAPAPASSLPHSLHRDVACSAVLPESGNSVRSVPEEDDAVERGLRLVALVLSSSDRAQAADRVARSGLLNPCLSAVVRAAALLAAKDVGADTGSAIHADSVLAAAAAAAQCLVRCVRLTAAASAACSEGGDMLADALAVLALPSADGSGAPLAARVVHPHIAATGVVGAARAESIADMRVLALAVAAAVCDAAVSLRVSQPGIMSSAASAAPAEKSDEDSDGEDGRELAERLDPLELEHAAGAGASSSWSPAQRAALALARFAPDIARSAAAAASAAASALGMSAYRTALMRCLAAMLRVPGALEGLVVASISPKDARWRDEAAAAHSKALDALEQAQEALESARGEAAKASGNDAATEAAVVGAKAALNVAQADAASVLLDVSDVEAASTPRGMLVSAWAAEATSALCEVALGSDDVRPEASPLAVLGWYSASVFPPGAAVRLPGSSGAALGVGEASTGSGIDEGAASAGPAATDKKKEKQKDKKGGSMAEEDAGAARKVPFVSDAQVLACSAVSEQERSWWAQLPLARSDADDDADAGKGGSKKDKGGKGGKSSKGAKADKEKKGKGGTGAPEEGEEDDGLLPLPPAHPGLSPFRLPGGFSLLDDAAALAGMEAPSPASASRCSGAPLHGLAAVASPALPPLPDGCVELAPAAPVAGRQARLSNAKSLVLRERCRHASAVLAQLLQPAADTVSYSPGAPSEAEQAAALELLLAAGVQPGAPLGRQPTLRDLAAAWCAGSPALPGLIALVLSPPPMPNARPSLAPARNPVPSPRPAPAAGPDSAPGSPGFAAGASEVLPGTASDASVEDSMFERVLHDMDAAAATVQAMSDAAVVAQTGLRPVDVALALGGASLPRASWLRECSRCAPPPAVLQGHFSGLCGLGAAPGREIAPPSAGAATAFTLPSAAVVAATMRGRRSAPRTEVEELTFDVVNAAGAVGGYAPGDGMDQAAKEALRARGLYLIHSLVARGLAREAAARQWCAWEEVAEETEADSGGKKDASKKKQAAGKRKDAAASAEADTDKAVLKPVRRASGCADSSALLGPTAAHWARLLRRRFAVTRFADCIADIDPVLRACRDCGAASSASPPPLVSGPSGFWRCAVLTPLHAAAEVGDEALVAMLIQAGASVNARDSRGRIPAMAAFDCGHTAVGMQLCRAGSDLRATDAAGDPLLKHAACAPGAADLRSIVAFAEAGVAVGVGSDAHGADSLRAAAAMPMPRLRDSLPAVQALEQSRSNTARFGHAAGSSAAHQARLDAAAEPGDAADAVAASRIQAAARGRAARALTAAIAAARQSCGRPASLLCDSAGASAAVRELLAMGCDASQCDAKGMSALHWLAGGGAICSRAGSLRTRSSCLMRPSDAVDAVAAAVEGGGDLDAADLKGRTALCHALFSGHSALALALLAGGASPVVADRSGSTALHFACLGRGWGAARAPPSSAPLPARAGLLPEDEVAAAAAAAARIAAARQAGGRADPGRVMGAGGLLPEAQPPARASSVFAAALSGPSAAAAAAEAAAPHAAGLVKTWAASGPAGLVGAILQRGLGRPIGKRPPASSVCGSALSAASALAGDVDRQRALLRARLSASLAAAAAPPATASSPCTARDLVGALNDSGVRPVHVLAGAGLHAAAVAEAGLGGRGHESGAAGDGIGGPARAADERNSTWPVEPAPGSAMTEETVALSMQRAAEEAETRLVMLHHLASMGAGVVDGDARGSLGLGAAHHWALSLLGPALAAVPPSWSTTAAGDLSPAALQDLPQAGSGAGRRARFAGGRVRAGGVHAQASVDSLESVGDAAASEAAGTASGDPIAGGDESAWPPRLNAASIGASVVAAVERRAELGARYLRASRAVLQALVAAAGGAAEAGGCDSQSLAGSGGRRFGPVHCALVAAAAAQGSETRLCVALGSVSTAPAAASSPSASPDGTPAPYRICELAAWMLLAESFPVHPATCNPPATHVAAAGGASVTLFETLVSAGAAEAREAERTAMAARDAFEAARDELLLADSTLADSLMAASWPTTAGMSATPPPVAVWGLPDARGVPGLPGRGERRHAGTALQAAAAAGNSAVVRWLLETAPRAAAFGAAGTTPAVSGESVGESGVSSTGDASPPLGQSQPFLKSPGRRGAGPDAGAREPSSPAARGSAGTRSPRQLRAANGWARQGLDVDARRPHSGRTALHLAAFEGHSAVVSLLLRAGASVTTRDADGESPLMSAVKGNHARVVRLLLLGRSQAPASEVVVRSASGETPLSLAERVNVHVWEQLGGDARALDGPPSPVARGMAGPSSDGADQLDLLAPVAEPALQGTPELEAVAARLQPVTQKSSQESDDITLTLLRVLAMAGGTADTHLHPCFGRGLTYGERAAAASGGMARVKRMRGKAAARQEGSAPARRATTKAGGASVAFAV